MTKSEFYEIYHKERKEDRRFMLNIIICTGIGLAGVIISAMALIHH